MRMYAQNHCGRSVIACVLPVEHRLAARAAVPLAELSGETLIVRPLRGGGSKCEWER